MKPSSSAALPEPPLLDVEVGEVAVAARVDLVEVLVRRAEDRQRRFAAATLALQHVADAARSTERARRGSGRRLPAASAAARAEEESRPLDVVDLHGQVGLHAPARGRAGPRSASRPRARRRRRAPLRRRRRAARRARGRRCTSGTRTSAWWLMLTPAASWSLAAAASPARWRRWRRRAGRSGSTPRRAARAARPRPRSTSGAPCSSAVAKNAAACVCAPDRAAAPAGVGGMAEHARRRRRLRARGGSARRDRRAGDDSRASSMRRWSETSPPGGRVSLIAMRHRSWRNATPRGPRRISPACVEGAQGGQPDAEVGEQVIGDRLRRARQEVEQVPGVGGRGRWCGRGSRRAPCGGSRGRRGRASRPRRTGCLR